MTEIATVGIGFAGGVRFAERDSRRDEVKRVIPCFCAHGVLSGFRHVATDTLTAGTCGSMVRMLGEGRKIGTNLLAGAMTGETERIR